MSQELIRSIENEQIREGIPDFRAGDTVKVFVKVVEGSKERIQPFEGVVITRRNATLSRKTITDQPESRVLPVPEKQLSRCIVPSIWRAAIRTREFS